MIPPWAYLDEQDRATFGAMVAFLERRLTEQGTIDWALGLKPKQRIERLAIDYVLNWPGAKLLDEPWGHAWRLIEESWTVGAIEESPSTAIYGIQERLSAGDRSGAIISAIVDLVSPRLKVEPIDSWQWRYVKKPRHPKKFDDLISARLTSGALIDMNVFKLTALSDIPFLCALANALDAAVSRGLDIARRIGWDGRPYLLGLGDLRRVLLLNFSSAGGLKWRLRRLSSWYRSCDKTSLCCCTANYRLRRRVSVAVCSALAACRLSGSCATLGGFGSELSTGSI